MFQKIYPSRIENFHMGIESCREMRRFSILGILIEGNIRICFFSGDTELSDVFKYV